MKMMKNSIIAVLAILASAACSPAVQLADKDIEMPDSFDGVKTDSISSATVSWEMFFPDTILQGHIRAALDSNLSFRSCMDRVLLAGYEAKSARLEYLPSVSAGIEAGSRRFGEYTMDGVGNTTTNTPDLESRYHIPDPYREFGLGLSFSWEVDIWGKVTQKKRAAAERWMASMDAVSMARSILISETACTYFELVGLDMEHEIISKAIEFTSRSCDLTAELKAAGEVTQLAADQFNARHLALQGMLLENEADIRNMERKLCILTGRFPEKVERTGFYELREMDLISDCGIPDLLLTCRPDIREAERLLKAADCDIKAARRAFYPGLRIGGSGGFNAFDITRFLMVPASLVYDIAAGITAPVFEAGRLRKEYSSAVVKRNMAVNSYKETVIKAYSEVAGLADATENLRQRIMLKKNEMRAGKRATESANELFRMQFIGYLEVLSADSEYFECCRSYIGLEIERLKMQAELYRSLGGGSSQSQPIQ